MEKHEIQKIIPLHDAAGVISWKLKGSWGISHAQI